MGPTTVLCAGMFRSGSTWAFNVTKALLTVSDPEIEVEAGYFEGEELDHMLSTRADHHRVIKCHFGSDALIRSIDNGVVDSVIYSQRDPMAALASCVEQFCSRLPFSDDWTFETAVERVGQGIALGVALRDIAGVLFLDLHRDGEERSFEAIAVRLGIRLSPAYEAQILEEFNFAHMRERSEHIGSVPAEELMRGINDPETLMHAGHVDKGSARDWTAELTLEQAMYASDQFSGRSLHTARH